MTSLEPLWPRDHLGHCLVLRVAQHLSSFFFTFVPLWLVDIDDLRAIISYTKHNVVAVQPQIP